MLHENRLGTYTDNNFGRDYKTLKAPFAASSRRRRIRFLVAAMFALSAVLLLSNRLYAVLV